MKNICIYGGHHYWKTITDKLIADGTFKYIMWLSKYSEGEYKTDNSFMSNIDHKKFIGLGTDIYDEVLRDIYIFMDMYSRNSALGQDDYSQNTIHDMLNIFNRSFDYYVHHLRLRHIEMVVFVRSPHNGHDYLLYKIAKALGLTTVILEQSFFQNKFFYFFENEDYGTFKYMRPFHSAEAFPIENKHQKDLLYMKTQSLWRRALKWRNPLSVKTFRSTFNMFLNSSAELRLIHQLCNRDTSGQAIFRYQLTRQYKKYIKELTVSQICYANKYVYFALHLQPECTTSNYGGIYCDQLLALERLSTILPRDWFIYVKENPKQNYFMRGKYFFKRLQSIPKIFLVSKTTDTYDLLANSQFAATISGTVGWEAITGGKNVLIFGRAWYQTLPGVFKYSDTLDIKSIVDYKIDHNMIEMMMGELYSKMATGMVYGNYDELMPIFDLNRNAENVCNSLKIILSLYNNNNCRN